MWKVSGLAALVALGAGGVGALTPQGIAQTHSLVTDWSSGGTYISVNNSGTFFDITAMNPEGITIQGFDVRSYGTAGTVFTGDLYYRQGSFQGFNHSAGDWTLWGSAQTASAGTTGQTPLPIGGLAIPSGETYGICINHSNGGVMYKPESTMQQFFSNDHIRLEMGASQEGLFSGTYWSPRGIVVNVHYTIGTSPIVGGCCLPDATCDVRSEHLCLAAGGTYEGNGSDCTVMCISGACCLRDGTCIAASPSGCETLKGSYQGDGTTCGAVPCPPPGACCLPTGCIIAAEARCDELDGEYRGHGTSCATAAPPCPAANTDHIVIPRHLADQSIAGGGTALSNSNPAVLQFVIAASEFDRIPPGSEVTGITWRVASAVGFNQTWPSSNNNLGRFDIEVATAVNPPGQMSMTFADNVGPDATLVRYGPLTIPALSFPGGASSPAPNDFGWVIPFTTPFEYQGGDVVFTIRRSAGSAGFTTHDIVGTNHGHLGYGTLFQGIQNTVSDHAPSANAISPGGAFFINKLTFTAPAAPPCYANCDGSTTPPILNVEDFVCFVSEFAAALLLPPQQQLTHYANCDESTTTPVLNVEDFICFVSKFATGCP
jgi:hypothetical protein